MKPDPKILPAFSKDHLRPIIPFIFATLLLFAGSLLTFQIFLLSPNQVLPRILIFLYIFVTICIVMISAVILAGKNSVRGFPYLDRFGAVIIGIASAAVLTFLFRHDILFFINGPRLVSTSQFSVLILIIHIITAVYALYLLENIYRYALSYQRRIGRLIFLGLLIIIGYQLILSSRWLLYGWLPVAWMNTFGIVNAICLGLVLLGIVKYRIAGERVKVTRGAVYSSFSLLFAGAFFTAVGISMLVLRHMGISLDSYDLRVLGISLSITLVIIGGSARMRRRVKKFINRRVYKAEHDYRSQFYELHRMSMQTEEEDHVFEEILEHLRTALNAEHAYLFLSDEHHDSYILQKPKERNLPEELKLKHRSALVRMLHEKGDYFGVLRMDQIPPTVTRTERTEEFDALHISDIAPVFHGGELLAVLAMRRDSSSPMKTEDIALVEVYTTTIGDLLFKRRILKERLEQKQFESFSHMASFIAHDVKNQVSTLKLLLRNAEKNISNPEFQKSLLVSLRHCSDNLTTLVQKLQQPPRKDKLKLSSTALAPIITRVMDETGLTRMEELTLETRIDENVWGIVDEQAVYYTVKNLVINALESMNGSRKSLTLRLGPIENAQEWVKTHFGSREELFRKHSVLISVEDTGCGMDRNFLETKLFHPFSTTKDKGVGIGLYQCKTLIEQMGGKIVCSSEIAKGSVFCIIL
ncbi:MAG: ATP-binding protein [Chitinispirillaceae bacterium]